MKQKDHWCVLSGRLPGRRWSVHHSQLFDRCWSVSWRLVKCHPFRLSAVISSAMSAFPLNTNVLDLENDFQLDRHAEWKTGDPIDQAARVFLAERHLEKVRRSIRDLRMVTNVPEVAMIHSKANDTSTRSSDSLDTVERAKMLASTASAFIAARRAALRPASTSSSAPTRAYKSRAPRLRSEASRSGKRRLPCLAPLPRRSRTARAGR